MKVINANLVSINGLRVDVRTIDAYWMRRHRENSNHSILCIKTRNGGYIESPSIHPSDEQQVMQWLDEAVAQNENIITINQNNVVYKRPFKTKHKDRAAAIQYAVEIIEKDPTVKGIIFI
jgi:hypothetical protein